jgi:geranylgeranyl pyrophosphate synthase
MHCGHEPRTVMQQQTLEPAANAALCSRALVDLSEANVPNGAVANGAVAHGASPNGTVADEAAGDGALVQVSGASGVANGAPVRASEGEMTQSLDTLADHLAERVDASSLSLTSRRGGGEPSELGASEGGEVVRDVDILGSLSRLRPQLKEVEDEIERMVSTAVKAVADVASHTLGAGGKRLRPALAVLSAHLCEPGSREGALPPAVLAGAVAVELTHTTTLLHDDVVDGAQVRRGKPAANLLWGNGMSVLVGDYLFAQVFLIASQKGFFQLMNPLAQATAQMCAGELLEVQKRRQLDMSEAEYEEVVALKTAALTECSCRIGAASVGATEEQIESLSRYGHLIGVAFQIVDDVFDVIASDKRIGKPVGNDIREGVVTLPMLRAMAQSGDGERQELRDLVGKEPIEDADVARALEIIRAGDAVESCLRTARGYVAQAKAQLEGFDDCPARQMLCDIADYVVSRDK